MVSATHLKKTAHSKYKFIVAACTSDHASVNFDKKTKFMMRQRGL